MRLSNWNQAVPRVGDVVQLLTEAKNLILPTAQYIETTVKERTYDPSDGKYTIELDKKIRTEEGQERLNLELVDGNYAESTWRVANPPMFVNELEIKLYPTSGEMLC